MSIQYFKIKRGTNFDKEIKEHFILIKKWDIIFQKISELLNENITKLVFSTDQLYVDTDELIKEENIKLFNNDGSLKAGLKKAEYFLNEYKKLINENGLSEFESLRSINSKFGVIPKKGQRLDSFQTTDNDIYYKCNFDLNKKTNGLVIPISEVEYDQTYLKQLKRENNGNLYMGGSI